MTIVDFGRALRLGLSNLAAAGDVIASTAASIDATDVTLYLVDFEQRVLEPLPNFEVHADLPQSEGVDGTMAGRAFLDQRPVTAERPEGIRVWVPVIEGSDRSGVLALTFSKVDEQVLQACEDLGLMAGCLIATHSRFTDVYGIHRRRKQMSLAANMQWDLLPPLVLRTPGVTVAGRVEPAYYVGGDCFDYAINGPQLDVAIFDSMGHGISSALTCALAVGCYRHGRREGRLLSHSHVAIDATLADQYGGGAFVTGQLARLDIESGTLTWTNAGHPRPLLVRDGRTIRQLDCRPTVPWGLGSGAPGVCTEDLQPGDRVVFFTDGVVEGRPPGPAGLAIEQLADLVGQHSSEQLPAEESVRRIVRTVLEHHEDTLHDDATVVMMDWHRSPRPGGD